MTVVIGLLGLVTIICFFAKAWKPAIILLIVCLILTGITNAFHKEDPPKSTVSSSQVSSAQNKVSAPSGSPSTSSKAVSGVGVKNSSSTSKLEYIPKLTSDKIKKFMKPYEIDFSGPETTETPGEFIDGGFAANSQLTCDIDEKSENQINGVWITFSDRKTLEYFATLPYEGSNPTEAKKWVDANINSKKATTTIGGVLFVLSRGSGSSNYGLTICTPSSGIQNDI